MIYEYYTALLILIWPLNCIIDCCWCFNFNSCPCIYLFIKTHLINVKMYNHPVIITKWNHFWVIQAPCSSRQGLFWWIRVHSLHVYGYVYAYVLFGISVFLRQCSRVAFPHLDEATSNRDLTLRCVSSTQQQQHKRFSWSLWAFRCEELLLHAFSVTSSFREQIWASGILGTSLCLRIALLNLSALEFVCWLL